jgi:hypothetical protein
MVQEIVAGASNGTRPKRGRGRNKPFPPISFEESLVLPKSINEHGVDGRIRRLTLLDKIDARPNSKKTRNLVSSAFKYGLIHGSFNSDFLQLTEDGHALLDKSTPLREAKAKQFEIAIDRIEPFSKLYGKLKDKRIPDVSILGDEIGGFGVEETDRLKAAEVFEMNLRYVGLVKEIAGSEHVVTIDGLALDGPEMDQDISLPRDTESYTETTTPIETNSKAPVQPQRPSLHIDFHVHIDPTSSAEQIDNIFASMARHFYGAES